MSDPDQPSDEALRALFNEARKAGDRKPVPQTPDWLAEDAFPVELHRFVAHGGAGFVWYGIHRATSQPVALKWVPFRDGSARDASRWQAECEALEALSHPHLVRCLDHGLAPDRQSGWLAMEWIEGQSLEEMLDRRGWIDLIEGVELVSQISCGLGSMHAAGLVHRDVKPSNILFEEATGRWVLADFGIVHHLQRDHAIRLTQTQESPQTPGFAPPESIDPDLEPDPRWDQFSLAVTVWETLAGQRPVGAFPKLQRLARAPAQVDRVLRRAMSSDRGRRYPDLASFSRALRAASYWPRWASGRWLYAAGVLSLGIALLWVSRPPDFPREFHSGPLRVTEGREHFMEVDLTLQEDGQFFGVIRTWSSDPLFGFTGVAQLVWRDGSGQVLKTQKSNPLGVNGRWVGGAAHERVDDWQDRLPPEIAAKVERVDFYAEPGGLSQAAREAANRRKIQRDWDQIRAGARNAWGSIRRILGGVESP